MAKRIAGSKAIEALALFALAACVGPASANGTQAAAPAPRGEPAACASALHAELDRASFAQREERPPFAAEQLEKLRQSGEMAFKTAADQLCADGNLKSGAFGKFKRLLIQSGSGATETAIYADAESGRADTLIFQWVFVEENLDLPDKADIRMGIICWADPQYPACGDRTP